jgi:hypothetical protein
MLEFSAAEMRRRRTAFGRELDRNDTAYALVYGANRSGSAVSWLTGWPVTREALLVVAPEPDDDVLLVSFFNHVPQARRLSATRVAPGYPTTGLSGCTPTRRAWRRWAEPPITCSSRAARRGRP